jgi:hypothetical protein
MIKQSKMFQIMILELRLRDAIIPFHWRKPVDLRYDLENAKRGSGTMIGNKSIGIFPYCEMLYPI